MFTLFLHLTVFSQNPEWVTFNYSNTSGALPTNSINCIAVDCTNVVWIGTNGEGTVKYESGNWTTYNSSNSSFNSSSVNDIEVDGSNNLWIAAGSLWKFDGSNWTSILPPSTTIISIESLDIRNEEIWVTGMVNWNNVIGKYSQNNWTLYPIPVLSSSSGMLSIAVDPSGIVWASSTDGLVKFDGVNWTLFNGSNTPFLGIYAHALDINTNGNLLVGMDGLYEFDGINWTSHNIPSAQDNVYSIHVTQNNELLAGTFMGGLNYFDGTNWASFQTSNSSIPANRIFGVTRDLLGHTWVATPSWGVGVYKQGGVTLDVNEDHFNDVTIKMFPNPVYSTLKIIVASLESTFTVLELKDCSGRTVYTQLIQTNSEEKINISNLAAGIYICQVQGKSVGKIVKTNQ